MGKGDVLGQEVEYVDADNWTLEEIYDPARTGSHESPSRKKRRGERDFFAWYSSRDHTLSRPISGKILPFIKFLDTWRRHVATTRLE